MEKFASDDILKEIDKRQERLASGVSILQRKLSRDGVPKAYKDERCKSANQWVYLYPDGYEEVVEINTASMIPIVVK